jgi:hypothetical protein
MLRGMCPALSISSLSTKLTPHPFHRRDKVLIGRLGDKGVKALEEDSKRAAEDEKKEKEARAKYAVNPFEFTPAQ